MHSGYILKEFVVVVIAAVVFMSIFLSIRL